MHGAVVRKEEVYYRCHARSTAPGSPALVDHPRTVNLREFDVVEQINGWVGCLFSPEHVDQTVAALVGSQDDAPGSRGSREAANQCSAWPDES